MHSHEKYAGLKGQNNPMHRPEVAAKQSAALKAHYARNGDKRKKSVWTPERRAQRAEAARQMWADGKGKGVAWSEERKEQKREQMRAYWAKVKAALALLGESQHESSSST